MVHRVLRDTRQVFGYLNLCLPNFKVMDSFHEVFLPYFVVTQVPFFCLNALSSRLDPIITEDTSVQAQLAS